MTPGNAASAARAETTYRTDRTTSNYYFDPAHANVREVGDQTVEVGPTYGVQVELPPNSLEPILLSWAGKSPHERQE